jgi:hypothetical protein
MSADIRIDPALIAEAREFSGIDDESMLIQEGLRALIQREAAHKLARMGGTMPDLEYIPRRRPWERSETE